jgi:hypothetical protein
MKEKSRDNADSRTKSMNHGTQMRKSFGKRGHVQKTALLNFCTRIYLLKGGGKFFKYRIASAKILFSIFNG